MQYRFSVLLLLLLTGCATPRLTFRVECMTGPVANEHGTMWPAFKEGCRKCNFCPDDKIDMKDFAALQNEYKKLMKWRRDETD